jgi:hypothetical protein
MEAAQNEPASRWQVPRLFYLHYFNTLLIKLVPDTGTVPDAATIDDAASFS